MMEVLELQAKLEPELLAKAIPHLAQEDFEEASGILNQLDVALKKRESPAGDRGDPLRLEPALCSNADFAH